MLTLEDSLAYFHFHRFAEGKVAGFNQSIFFRFEKEAGSVLVLKYDGAPENGKPARHKRQSQWGSVYLYHQQRENF